MIMSTHFSETLRSMATRSRTVAADAHLFHREDPVSDLFIVETGRIDLQRHSDSGTVIILQRAGAGDLLAEASLFSTRYHCDAVATAPASVLCIPKQRLRGRLRGDSDFAEAWMQHLGVKIQAMRLRSEILSLKTVAERLDAWLTWHGEAPAKGEWKRLAQEIGISPEALYRELSNRRS